MSNSTATPLQVCPWVTYWDKEVVIAAITSGKVHRVTVRTFSNNTESGVADPDAPRNVSAQTHCGTVRPGFRRNMLKVAEEITCLKCAK